MTMVIKRHAKTAMLLLGFLAVALFVAPAAAATALATNAPAGYGFWGALGCLGCITGFVVGGGTTVAGLAAFLAANPEIGIYCVSTCLALAT